METTHSKTGRTKKPTPKIVVDSWDSIWDSFSADHQKTTIEAMNSEGWKTIEQASKEIGLSKPRINQMANDGIIDRIKRKIYYDGITREMNFVRPLV